MRIFGRRVTRPGGGLLRRVLPVRISRRLLELSAGAAILPVGALLAVTVTSDQGTLVSAATPGGGLASSLVGFHDGPLTAGISADPSVAGPPSLTTLPPAPHLSTPTPRPQPQVHYAAGSIKAIITAAGDRYGVSPSWLISTAECESGLNPRAYNPSGPYYGLFQFLRSTFAAHGGTNIWDPTQQANIAASMFASGDSSAWPVCSHA